VPNTATYYDMASITALKEAPAYTTGQAVSYTQNISIGLTLKALDFLNTSLR
jgi:hypothetical protein